MVDPPDESTLAESVVAMDNEQAIIKSTSNNTPGPGDKLTAAPSASDQNTIDTDDTTTNTTSPFLNILGELRNRVYRRYFEDFEEQMSRRFAYNKFKMSPNFLALMHTNREVRSEAGFIFYKELAIFHSFSCPTDQPMEAVVLSRMRDVCSLISIRDEQMRISIHCTPNWKDLRRPGLGDGDDAWSLREIGAFARSLSVHFARKAGPLKVTHRQNPSSSSAAESTVEVRAGKDFLVRYRYRAVCEYDNYLYVEGPLAKVDWSKERGR